MCRPFGASGRTNFSVRKVARRENLGGKLLLFLADSNSMERRQAPRVAVMKRIEVLWEDDTHALRGAPATIIDRASGGICLQMTIPIAIGSKLTIKERDERFSGIVVNSRREHKDYILAIQWNVDASLSTK